MPFEIMDQRGATASSHFFEDNIRLPAERQVGFWKPYAMTEHQGALGTLPMSGTKFVPSTPYESLSPASAMSYELPPRSTNEKLRNGEGSTNMPKAAWNSVDHHPKSWSNLSSLPAGHSLGRNGASITGTEWESSLFSSSFSEIFNRNMRLTGNEVQSREPTKTSISALEEEEPFESLEQIEAQTIGNLLPAEDDLFSGVTNELGHIVNTTGGDELEDFDLFSSGGGMELEGDNHMIAGRKNLDLFGLPNGSTVGKHPFGELPSRTLFVRNINSNVEDSELKTLFEQYGDIRTLYTACKHRGFVMISYYDIRAAQNAMRSLQDKPLKRRKLDIHFSIPKENPSEKDVNQGILTVRNLDSSSVPTDELHKIFSAYGELKEICATPNKDNNILIEYYDVRAAEAALSALNRTDIAGKQIKLEPSPMGPARRAEQEQDESDRVSQFDDLSSMRMAFSPAVIASSCIDSGSSQVQHGGHSPAGAFIEHHHSSSVPSHLPSPVTATSVSKQFSHPDHKHSIQEMRFGNQSMHTFHPHSLPEYHDGLSNGIPYNSASNLGGMAGSVGSKAMEGINGRHVRGVVSGAHPMELNGRGSLGFRSLGNGNTLPGHYAWNNSTSVHQQPSNHMIWANSASSFVNGVPAHPLSRLTGFPRAPPVMLNTGPAPHHVGSAPAVNPSLWESPDTSSFHMGSFGSMGFPSSSPPHQMEMTSRNMYSHVNGNCVDMTKSAGIRSPQQMGHLFPGRNPMGSMPLSFDSPSDRIRNLSHRRMESNSNHSDKKQYELDVERILHGEDTRTTLMIKNIPNNIIFSLLLILIFLTGTPLRCFFLQLTSTVVDPMILFICPLTLRQNKCNVGYAFINMIDPKQIIPFHKAFNGKKWEKFNSEKVASLAYARIQGKSALIAHFQNSSLMNEDKRCRPILFHTDGPNAGDPEPFPMGTNIRSRMGRPRTIGHDEHQHHSQGSPSAITGEDGSNDASSNSD
ncbi:Protein MEI2-like 4 [Linum perenne]